MNRQMNQKSGAARRPGAQGFTERQGASTLPSFTPTRTCSGAPPPKPTCSASNGSKSTSQILCDEVLVDVLVEFRYLAEAQAGDRDAIGKAMGAALKSLLTR
jgi:hypothetical protein